MIDEANLKGDFSTACRNDTAKVLNVQNIDAILNRLKSLLQIRIYLHNLDRRLYIL